MSNIIDDIHAISNNWYWLIFYIFSNTNDHCLQSCASREIGSRLILCAVFVIMRLRGFNCDEECVILLISGQIQIWSNWSESKLINSYQLKYFIWNFHFYYRTVEKMDYFLLKAVGNYLENFYFGHHVDCSCHSRLGLFCQILHHLCN